MNGKPYQGGTVSGDTRMRSMMMKSIQSAVIGQSLRAEPSPVTQGSRMRRRIKGLVVFCLVLGVTGCGSWDPRNWFGRQEPDSPYAGQEAPGDDQPYPSVSSIPERPASGLVADIRDRLYEEDAARDADIAADSGPTPPPEPMPAPIQPVIADSADPAEQSAENLEPPTDTARSVDPDTPDDVTGNGEDSAAQNPADERGDLSSAVLAPDNPDLLARPRVSIKMETLYFPFGSSYISPQDRRYIQEIASVAREKKALLRVIGHASSFTRDMSWADHRLANFTVSLKRAQAVANVILDTGFDGDRISIDARSDADPLFREVMPAGRRGNQRVDVYMEY